MSFEQNVPLGPVDRRRAARRHWLRRARSPRRRLVDATLLLGLLGLLLGLGGVWLATRPPRVEVSVTPRAYRVGGTTLPARGGGVYQGGAGVIVLHDAGGRLDGAASATTAGAPMTAHCEGAAASERCTFQIGPRTLHAVDTWQAGAWTRTYGNGKRVQLTVAQGRPVPVPVPIDAPPPPGPSPFARIGLLATAG